MALELSAIVGIVLMAVGNVMVAVIMMEMVIGDHDGDGGDNGDSKGDGGGGGDGDGNPQVGSVMVLWGLLLCYTTKVIMVFYNTSFLNTVPHVRFFQLFSSTIQFKVSSDHGEFCLLLNL